MDNMYTYKCIVCGKEFYKSEYMSPYQNICSSECFSINYWNERILNKNDPCSVIIAHTAYWIGDEDSKSCFRGFGGAKFRIKFFDGRYIETTNLWYNGDIPKKYWSKLPDNAEFIVE